MATTFAHTKEGPWPVGFLERACRVLAEGTGDRGMVEALALTTWVVDSWV